MPLDKRTEAAEAFWRDRDSPDIEAQHVEAVLMLAKRLNFRVKSIQALPVEKRAKHLAHVTDVSDAVATRALIAYHFTAKPCAHERVSRRARHQARPWPHRR